MTRYIENVNVYLSEMKIKHTFISMKTGIDKNKLSRILTWSQEVNSTDMEKIAKALGQKIEFFLEDNFVLSPEEQFFVNEVAFYQGKPSKKQEDFASQLIELIVTKSTEDDVEENIAEDYGIKKFV